MQHQPHRDDLLVAHVFASQAARGWRLVRRELWTTLLGYNLIRTVAAAAVLDDKQSRHISFTGNCQYVLASWWMFSTDRFAVHQLLACCRALLGKLPNAKSPTVPAASSHANSNDADTAVN